MDRWTKTQFKLKISDYIPAKWVFLSMLRLSWVSREADRPGCQSWGMMAATRHRRSRVRRKTWDVRHRHWQSTGPETISWHKLPVQCKWVTGTMTNISWSLKIIWGIESLVFQRMNQGGRFGTVGTRSQQLQGRKTALLQPFPWEWHQEEQEGTRLEYLDKNNFLPKIISKRSAVGLPGD